MSRKTISLIKLIGLAFVIIGIPILLYVFCGDTIFSKEWLNELPKALKNNRSKALCWLIGLQILQVIICILPGQPIQFASSYLFGVFGGYLISICGALFGAWAAFLIAKKLGADAVEELFDRDKVEFYRKKLNSGKGYMLVLLIYLIPGIPKDLVAYVAGISEMKLRPFLVVSSIGRTPGMLGSLLMGYYMGKSNYTAIVIIAAIVAVILLICFIKRKELLEYLDEIESGEKKRVQRNG